MPTNAYVTPGITDAARHPSVFAASKSGDDTAGFSTNSAQFEMQELRANLNTIVERDIPPILLSEPKRDELMSYCGAVISDFQTRLDEDAGVQGGWRTAVFNAMMGKHILPNSPGFGEAQARAETLAGSRWKLAFSTEGTVLSQLPRGANVVLDFLDDRSLEYKLVFKNDPKSWFTLDDIVATSSYTVNEADNPGLVTYTYEKVTADVFGGNTIPVGLFGMLKGQTNFIYPAYYDGNIWVEYGIAPDGEEYYSIFVQVKK